MDGLATLLLAHLIADFPLQTNWLFQLKARTWVGVLIHSSIHCVVTGLLLEDPLAVWPILVALGTTHFVTDWFKIRKRPVSESFGFILDQIAHVVALLGLWLLPWPFRIVGLLPSTLLFPAVAYAAVPATLMFLSVLTRDLENSSRVALTSMSDMALRFKTLSQVAGLPLAVGVIIARIGGKA